MASILVPNRQRSIFAKGMTIHLKCDSTLTLTRPHQRSPIGVRSPNVLKSNFGAQFRSFHVWIRSAVFTMPTLQLGVRELAEKRFRVSKVGRVKIFGEVAVDTRQQVMCVCAFIQPTPQAAQTQRGSKLQRFRVLLASDLQRP